MNLSVMVQFVGFVAGRDIGLVVHGVLTGNTAGVLVNGFFMNRFVMPGFVVHRLFVHGLFVHGFSVRGVLVHRLFVHGLFVCRFFVHGGGCRGPVRCAGRGGRDVPAGLECLRRDNVLALGPLDLLLGPELFSGQRSAGAAENFTGGVVTVDRAHCSLPFWAECVAQIACLVPDRPERHPRLAPARTPRKRGPQPPSPWPFAYQLHVAGYLPLQPDQLPYGDFGCSCQARARLAGCPRPSRKPAAG